MTNEQIKKLCKEKESKHRILFILAFIFLFTIVSCQEEGNNVNTSLINVALAQDSSKLKGDSTDSKQDNQLLTHFIEIWKEKKVDFKDIFNQINYNHWHAIRVSLLWISIGVVLIIFIRLIYLWLYAIFSESRRQSFRYRHIGLQAAAYITLISGFILYYIGFFKTGTASSVVAYLVRPFIASLGMFVGNTSYQEVCEECTSSPVYMTLFGIVHLSAIIISAIVIINFFWKRFSSIFIRMWWKIQALVLNQKKNVNIFWGSNEPSFILAEEMKSKGEHIVFIDYPSTNTGKNQQMSLSQIFGMYPYDHEMMRQLRGSHCIIMNTTYDISIEDDSNDYILDKLGIGYLRKIIKSSDVARFFFLSDKTEDNIKAIINLKKDFLFKHPNCHIDIFGHAPRNNYNIALERKHREEGDYAKMPAIHIIDSSYLAIQWLKTTPNYHPVQFVTQTEEEQRRGVVNDSFNALIVGFGETGQEALAFLYEFGAFVNDKHVRSPFCCHIADPNIKSLKSEFYMKRPALRDKKEIVFMNVSDKDEEYWTKIEEIMPKLQYIIVSTGTDESNMKIATNLYQLAIRCRNNNLSHFKIFVRSYLKKNESWIDSILSYYNTNNQSSQGEIVAFGKMTDIYKYDNIVIDKVLREAKVYGKKYYEAFLKYEQIVGKENLQLSGLSAIRKNHRSLSQDIANSLHASTKFLLMGLNKDRLKKLFTVSDTNLTEKEKEMKAWLIEIMNYSDGHQFRFEKDPKMIQKDEVKLLMYNMAMCEHFRWNAAHEMMGYTYGKEKNEVVKQHDCLTDFSKLPVFTQKPLYHKGDYDFLVLETSIKLKDEEYSNRKPNE